MSNNFKNAYGNSIDLNIISDMDDNFAEIKANIPVTTYNSIRVWGQVVDQDGNPVPYALMKLLKSTSRGYTGIAHTTADCQGYYQFDVCPDRSANYKILASKCPTGEEFSLENPGNCPLNPDINNGCGEE